MSTLFEYNVCNQADEELFYKQCAAIEKAISFLKKEPLLEDVDGTLVQKYVAPSGKITVRNDVQTDALYVLSEFDLLPYFLR